MSVFVIAEVGVNHNGSLELAKKLINVAKDCGADAVKFQTFKTEKLVTDKAKKAQYQSTNDESSSTQAEMLKRLELTLDDFSELKAECERRDIAFMTTCFDSESLREICEVAPPHVLKIGSGELTNLPFLIEHARTNRDIIISTGMATLSEVEDAVAALAFGYLSTEPRPVSYQWLKRNFFTAEALQALQDRVTILHCVTDYPAKPDDLNLDALRQLKSAFKLRVGYSDHSLGMEACCGAVALGASCLEKHITLDKSMAGPDHAASSTPDEFRSFVTSIRNLEKALVPRVKAPTESERQTAEIARKHVVAARSIKKGQVLVAEDLEVKRSSFGLSPAQIWNLIGTEASRDLEPGDNL